MAVPKVTTWILVADGARARLLVNEGPGKGIRPLEAHENPHMHDRTRDLGTERPGRVQESANAARHSMEPRVDWHTWEKHLFAKGLAESLNAAAAAGKFDRLVLVAPPHILGELRVALNKKVREKISGEINKDLTHMPDRDLLAPLGDVLAV
ncbi:MAG: host attachment protein [Alphaproteobacteria bacterium]